MFREYIEQVKQDEATELEKEKKKHGSDYIPQKRPFQRGDEEIFNLKDDEISVRENVFREVVNNLLKQDDRFGNFDKKILYLDCNNLYGIYSFIIYLFWYNDNYLGSVQTLNLPLKDFRWDNDFASELETFFRNRANDYARDVQTQSWDSYFGVTQKNTGYYIEADITFSDKTKKKLRDFPPVPVHTSLEFADLSNFAKDSYKAVYGLENEYDPESKLMLTFDKKERYVIHSSLADEYSLHGVEFANIRNVLAFTQETFLKSWVELNTEGRKRASLDGNESLRQFFKVCKENNVIIHK